MKAIALEVNLTLIFTTFQNTHLVLVDPAVYYWPWIITRLVLSQSLLKIEPRVIPLRGQVEGLLEWHHHHDDEILYCCRRFFRLIKPSRDWRAGVPKCAPQSAAQLQVGSFKKLVGPALCAQPYSVPSPKWLLLDRLLLLQTWAKFDHLSSGCKKNVLCFHLCKIRKMIIQPVDSLKSF